MSDILFDASTFADKKSRDVLPQGPYRLTIDAVTKKPTKDNTGAYLELAYTVLDGEHAGRKLWHIFNLWNKSPKAVEIAQGEIKELCAALGIFTPTAQMLEGKTVVATVKVSKRSDNGEPENRIAKYETDAGPGVVRTAAPTAPNAPKWSTARPAA
jgi:hypothetical protein